MRENEKIYREIRNQYILDTLSGMDPMVVALMIISASSEDYLESLYAGLKTIKGEEEE